MKEELLLPFEPEITPLMQKYIDMAEEAKQIMLQERQAKERLAAKLKELGIDLETVV